MFMIIDLVIVILLVLQFLIMIGFYKNSSRQPLYCLMIDLSIILLTACLTGVYLSGAFLVAVVMNILLQAHSVFFGMVVE